MPDTKSQLNDIILNKGNESTGMKKVLLAVAVFAVLLIVVIVIMSSLNKDNKNSLSNTVLPPEPGTVKEDKSKLFQAVDVVEEKVDDEQKRLESIANEIKAKALKTESEKEIEAKNNITVEDEVVTIEDPYEEPKTKEPVKVKEPVKAKEEPKVVTPKKVTPPKVQAKKGSWYVQVGSFAHSTPNKRLIEKITTLGFDHKLYKSTIKGNEVTKLLIGPYETYKEAQKAKVSVKAQIEPNAFVYQVVQ